MGMQRITGDIQLFTAISPCLACVQYTAAVDMAAMSSMKNAASALLLHRQNSVVAYCTRCLLACTGRPPQGRPPMPVSATVMLSVPEVRLHLQQPAQHRHYCTTLVLLYAQAIIAVVTAALLQSHGNGSHRTGT
jgi:hypothetical protein